MRSRQSIPEMFATFLQFEAERFNGWVYDAKLRRSIQTLWLKVPETNTTDNFWAIYWHKAWQTQPDSLALGHLL
jgi:hypothetical protein